MSHRQLSVEAARAAVRHALAAVGLGPGDLRFAREGWISQGVFRRPWAARLVKLRRSFYAVKVDCWRTDWTLKGLGGRRYRVVAVVALDGAVTLLNVDRVLLDPARPGVRLRHR